MFAGGGFHMHHIGDINEQHPQLLPALAFSVAALLIPESWILRPLLSVFGFGPAGPVKGALKLSSITTHCELSSMLQALLLLGCRDIFGALQ